MSPDLASELQIVTGNRQQAAWVTLLKAIVAEIFFNLTAHATLLTQKSQLLLRADQLAISGQPNPD